MRTRAIHRRHMTRHASFFCVAINATERQIMVWCVVSRADGIPCILPASAHYAAESMVA
ncbi:hypothetical protein HQH61_27690, partial [Escherichia coli]|nr:hypothetical protein [Escherichia coli]